MARDFAETIIDWTFRCTTFFGLSTHLYDRTARKATFSQRSFVYSAILHTLELLLFPSAFSTILKEQLEESKNLFFVHKLFFLVMGINLVAISVSIGTQWTRRARAPQLINKILDLWHKDMTHLQSNAKISRTAGKLCLIKIVAAVLVMTNTAIVNFFSVETSLLSLAACVYLWMLMSIVVAIQYQISMGLLLGAYLFETLNWNLTRIVKDISGLCETYSSHRAHQLGRELFVVGQFHRRLQKWVLSYKDLFQFEFLLNLTAFFVSQVCMLFLLLRRSFEVRKGTFTGMSSQLVLGVGLALFYTFDNLVILYICGRVVGASSEAGQILKELPAGKLHSKRLERVIEMVCFELQRERMRLSICGLADVDGNTGFAKTESAMMNIILLIQIDYFKF